MPRTHGELVDRLHKVLKERENVDLADGSAGQNSFTIVLEIPPSTVCKGLTLAGAFISPEGLRELNDEKFKQLSNLKRLILEEEDLQI